MRLIEGWLEEDEAELLIATTARALTVFHNLRQWLKLAAIVAALR